MKKAWEWTRWTLQIILGSALFSLGFDLFMEPHSFNAGGITGLAQILFNLTDWLSVAPCFLSGVCGSERGSFSGPCWAWPPLR